MSVASLTSAHLEFEAALPAVDQAAHYAFRRRHPQDRQEAVAEARAVAWSAWYGLIKRGKNPIELGVHGIAHNAVRFVRSGRRVGNSSRGRGRRDIFHPRSQAARGFKIISLPRDQEGDHEPSRGAWKAWSVTDNRCTPADEACFRIDFEGWLTSLPERKRHMAELLAGGHETGVVARMLGVTPGAVSQARTWLAASWKDFQSQCAAGS